MKVLLIHQVFVPPTEAGGTRHYEFARHMVKAGEDFAIVASSLSYLTGRKATAQSGLITTELLNGIRVYRAYTYPSLHKSFTWRIISFLSFMCTSVIAGLRSGPVDLVIGTSPPIFQAVSAWVIAFLRHKPFLLEIRDLWPDFAIDMGVLKSRALIRISRWLEMFLYKQASHILVNSPAYRDYLLRKGVADGKITVIPNGVDPEMFAPGLDRESVREKFGADGKFLVTYAGALGMANDIPTILKAAARLKGEPGIRFLIVGDGKESASARNLAASLDTNNVVFAGARPKSEMPGILAASDACVATLLDIPMFRTTFPNKIFDYMAAGKPTVLAIDGVIRRVMEEAQGGICINPGDAEQLANAVLCLYRDRRKGEKMGCAARDYVLTHFNRHTHAEQFRSLCHRLSPSRA